MNMNTTVLRSMTLVMLSLLTACEEQPTHLGRKLSSWVFDLQAKEDFKRQQALEAIAKIGEPAAAALDTVHPLLNDVHPGVQGAACEALARIGPKGRALLETELTRPEPDSRFFAAFALVRFDPAHAGGLQELVRILTGVGNVELSRNAQDVLVRVGEPAVAVLVPELDGDYLPVRVEVARTLGRMEKQAKSALPRLMKIAQGANEPVELRKATLHALAQVGERVELEAAFEALTESQPDDVAITAAMMLKHIGARPSPTGNEGVD